ncbi:hypothetical protein C8R45DRAFT_950064 [Mycena sanguinolenta]|nr:hypothetical protein C8R45DRAFT_950064 [Mycena sanguinolenta]
MATPRAQVKTVIKAVTNYIQSDEYEPPFLPIIPQEDWHSIFEQSGELRFNERLAAGTVALDFALFVLVSELDSFTGKPYAFVQIIQQAVTSPDVLMKIIGSTDPDLHCTIDQAEHGFRYFIGYLWGRATQNMDELLPSLRAIFEPLLQVAAAAYDAHVSKSAAGVKLEEKEKTRKEYVVAFMKNVEIYQASEHENLDASPSDCVKSPIILYSSPSIASLDLTNITCLDPSLLERRQPPSPSTPSRGHLPLPGGFGSHSVLTRRPSPRNLEAEFGLADLSDDRLVYRDHAERYPRSPTTPAEQDMLARLRRRLDSYEGYGVWASLPSPSGLQAELPLLDHSIKRAAASEDGDMPMSPRQGLLPPFQSPLPVPEEKLKKLFDGMVKATKLAEKSAEFYSSSPSARLGPTSGPSKMVRIRCSASSSSSDSPKLGSGSGGWQFHYRRSRCFAHGVYSAHFPRVCFSLKFCKTSPLALTSPRRALTPHNR